VPLNNVPFVFPFPARSISQFHCRSHSNHRFNVASMVIMSPSCINAISHPTALPGTWPMIKPYKHRTVHPSAMLHHWRAWYSTMADVSQHSSIPGPPCGPSYRMITTVFFFSSNYIPRLWALLLPRQTIHRFSERTNLPALCDCHGSFGIHCPRKILMCPLDLIWFFFYYF
jgi:hypothetical protein